MAQFNREEHWEWNVTARDVIYLTSVTWRWKIGLGHWGCSCRQPEETHWCAVLWLQVSPWKIDNLSEQVILDDPKTSLLLLYGDVTLYGSSVCSDWPHSCKSCKSFLPLKVLLVFFWLCVASLLASFSSLSFSVSLQVYFCLGLSLPPTGSTYTTSIDLPVAGPAHPPLPLFSPFFLFYFSFELKDHKNLIIL